MHASWLALCGVFCLGMSLMAEGHQPLPSADAVLRLVSTNAFREAKNDRAFRRRYPFIKSRTEIEKSARGEIKKQTTSLVTNTPKSEFQGSPDSFKFIKGRDTEASPISNPTRGPAAKPGKRPGGKREFQMDDELLSQFRFDVTQREIRHGRPAVRLTFSPRLEVPERDMKTRFLRRMAGEAWIDESEGVLLTLDVRMTSPLEIAGGLAGSIKSFEFHSERERTPEGLWFTKDLNYRVDYREIFTRKIMETSESITVTPPSTATPSASAPNPPTSSTSTDP
jgi:hypothetical protein